MILKLKPVGTAVPREELLRQVEEWKADIITTCRKGGLHGTRINLVRQRLNRIIAALKK